MVFTLSTPHRLQPRNISTPWTAALAGCDRESADPRGMAAGETAVYRFGPSTTRVRPALKRGIHRRYRRLSGGAATGEQVRVEADVTISADGEQGDWHTADVTITVGEKDGHRRRR